MTHNKDLTGNRMQDRMRLIALTAIIFTAIILLMKPSAVSAAAKQASAANGATAYFAVDDTIYSLNTKTGTYKKIKKLGKPYYISDISYYKNYLYFTGNYYLGSDGQDTYICRIKTNGTGFKKIAPGQRPCVYGGKIYYVQCKAISYGAGTYTLCTGIGRMSLTGSGKKTITNFPTNISFAQMVVAKNRIFYCNAGKLYSCSLTGGSSKSHGAAQSLLTDGTAAYYVSGGYVCKITTGGKITQLLPVKSSRYSTYTTILGIRNGYLYLSDNPYAPSGSKFYKYKLSTKKTSNINNYSITDISFASGSYIAVHRYMGNGKYEGSRMTIAGKKYKVIQKFFRS